MLLPLFAAVMTLVSSGMVMLYLKQHPYMIGTLMFKTMTFFPKMMAEGMVHSIKETLYGITEPATINDEPLEQQAILCLTISMTLTAVLAQVPLPKHMAS